jgi:hypothetical protein
MKYFWYRGWGAALLFLISNGAVADCVTEIRSMPTYIIFDGCISDMSVADLLKPLQEKSDRELFFASDGGAVEAAIRLAEVLHARKVKVTFFDRCLSSCANYIIPSSVRPTFMPRTRAALHGDANLTLQTISAQSVGEHLYSQVKRISELEMNLHLANDRVADVHALQAIARHPRGGSIRVRFQGSELVCSGHGQLLWAPSQNLLTKLNIRVDTRPPSALPYPVGRISDGGKVPVINPLSTCRPSESRKAGRI